MISGEPEDEADLQFGDLERIFCIGEMICRYFYCFLAGSWRFAGLKYASSTVASYSSNVQPHLLLFAGSQGMVVLLQVVWSAGGQRFSHHHLEIHSVICPLIFFFFIYLWGWNECCILQSGEMEKEKHRSQNGSHFNLLQYYISFERRFSLISFSEAFLACFLYEYTKFTLALPLTVLNTLSSNSVSSVL